MDTVEDNQEYSYECNICYETPYDISDSIQLVCCNGSKKICISCIDCLTTPICPYCRKKLPDDCIPYINETCNISRSEPTPTFTWEHFLEEENIINPYLYDNSRRLRRQIRRLRHEYHERRTEIYGQQYSIPRRDRNRYYRNERQRLQNYVRNTQQIYNNNHDNEMFSMDDL